MLEPQAPHGCPFRYCRRMVLQPYTILSKGGLVQPFLYLVADGEAGLYETFPQGGEASAAE